MDLGLCVKHGAKGMCVPDYVQAQPDNNGWAYSQALVTVIEQYKVGADLVTGTLNDSAACCTFFSP